MLDGVQFGPVVGYGTGWVVAVGLTIWIIRRLSDGTWITKVQHDREIAVMVQQVERADHDATEWRTEGRVKDQQVVVLYEVIHEKDRQLAHMGEVGRTAIATLDAVKALAQGQRPGESE